MGLGDTCARADGDRYVSGSLPAVRVSGVVESRSRRLAIAALCAQAISGASIERSFIPKAGTANQFGGTSNPRLSRAVYGVVQKSQNEMRMTSRLNRVADRRTSGDVSLRDVRTEPMSGEGAAAKRSSLEALAALAAALDDTQRALDELVSRTDRVLDGAAREPSQKPSRRD